MCVGGAGRGGMWHCDLRIVTPTASFKTGAAEEARPSVALPQLRALPPFLPCQSLSTTSRVHKLFMWVRGVSDAYVCVWVRRGSEFHVWSLGKRTDPIWAEELKRERNPLKEKLHWEFRYILETHRTSSWEFIPLSPKTQGKGKLQLTAGLHTGEQHKPVFRVRKD